MLNNLWYAVELSSAISSKPKQITLMGQNFVLYRNDQGEIIALDDRCAHRGAALSVGWVENNCLRCPYHGWLYDEEGQCVEIPANQSDMAIPKRARVNHYSIVERHGFVWLWIGEATPNFDLLPVLLFDPSGWQSSENEYRWNAHYSRIIENTNDISHAPFVHRRLAQRKDNNFKVAPLTVEPISEIAASVTVVTPMQKLKGIWQGLVMQQGNAGATRRHTLYLPNFTTLELNFGRFKFAMVIAHIPVSDQVTISKFLILRNFFKFSLFDRTVNQFGRKLLREDEIVVQSQPLQFNVADEKSELLVASDVMLLAYHKMYRKHLETQKHSIER